MTLARTALRLCAVSTLKGATGARPTIAESRVYDSRISDFTPEDYEDDAKPSVIVLTDSDDGEALSEQNGGPPFHRMIDLVVEIGMVQALQDGADYIVGYPDTDKRLEASLDALEFQIMRRLAYDPAPLSVLFRKFVRIRKHECHRQVLDDTGVKIAARLLTLTCEVNDDQVIVYNQSPTASPAIPTGFDVLPEPLRSVAKALPAGSAELDVCNALAAALAPVTAPPLKGVDTTFDADPARKAPTVVGTIELLQS
jgi:hypothetical protein